MITQRTQPPARHSRSSEAIRHSMQDSAIAHRQTTITHFGSSSRRDLSIELSAPRVRALPLYVSISGRRCPAAAAASIPFRPQGQLDRCALAWPPTEGVPAP